MSIGGVCRYLVKLKCCVVSGGIVVVLGCVMFIMMMLVLGNMVEVIVVSNECFEVSYVLLVVCMVFVLVEIGKCLGIVLILV